MDLEINSTMDIWETNKKMIKKVKVKRKEPMQLVTKPMLRIRIAKIRRLMSHLHLANRLAIMTRVKKSKRHQDRLKRRSE